MTNEEFSKQLLEETQQQHDAIRALPKYEIADPEFGKIQAHLDRTRVFVSRGEDFEPEF